MKWETTDEREWITKVGYRAFLCRYGDHYCGYVGIPQTHSLYGVEYNQESETLKTAAEEAMNKPIGKRGIISLFCIALKGNVSPRPDGIFDVHGSLTFSEGALKSVKQEEPTWWFGFDCGHYGDTLEKCNAEYVTAECESLARQLKELEGVAC